jgi:hypothetical protein
MRIPRTERVLVTEILLFIQGKRKLQETILSKAESDWRSTGKENIQSTSGWFLRGSRLSSCD